MITKKISFLLIIIFTTLHSFSQDKFTLSGTIKDSKNNETLIGVNIYIPALKIGTTTNEYGFYSITVPRGEHEIEISYVGYQTIQQTITLNQNTKNNFSISESGEELQEVVITDNKKKINIKSPEMSVNKLSISTIKKMPVVLGEVDVLKSILLLPGVTNAGEGASGFNVRGGGADQNLILLDEATIFNSSHVFGFFSVFNPDAIKDLKLYKGGIPARFGGRASSVLDIYQKDGSSKNFHMNGGIGLVSSRLLLEGPIVKDKGSFLIGGRGSYAHLFLKLSEDNKDNSAYFYDLNAKLSYKLNDNNNLYLSGYFGRDVFSLNKSFTNIYGNSTLNLRWNHLYSDKLFSNLSLIYSDYYYGLDLDYVGFKWDSGIQNYNIKYDFKHYISDKFKLNYGVNGIYYEFNPGTIIPSNTTSGINPDQLDKKYAFEPSIYLDAENQLSKRITLAYGLRYSLFYRLGSSTINYYDNNSPVVFNSDTEVYEKGIPTSTKYFGKNKVIQDYNNFEPRLSISYQLNDDQSIKASYNRMAQYLQLISNTSSPTPLDVWMPSDNYIKPQIADQVALGYFRNIKEGAYSLEVETYYKKIQNRLDYIDGADLIANNAIEQVILNGRMRAYGLEIMVKKNEGKFNGWVSYTLSKSEQQTPGRTPEEIGINNGQWYSTPYDKTHNLAITSAYNLNEKWSFGANFALQSGQPVTYPNAQYEYLGITVPSYGLRNENRLPAYHHLDVSATLTPRSNKGRNWKGEWVFSIYNLYNRSNAASINFRQNSDTGLNEAVRLSIFGIVPAVSYNFKF
ncbi:TonB-dependent receptor [Flavobacterium sp. WLB]|uniref:TonB-dependent receptor n=1 Tax=unclassified Flavobacterium TaxID=196869 RepID=UPI0006ABD6B5|nr:MULTISPECIES: TonB-dependent receptor [unclassified Flavobacterium]KOP39129.1 collagen-binding protein [Flavobacterium sp. VMW]OWU89212.1 collagen-binding protein [Flavobacterium sp. NLM]PUU68337.1 TonB-dependent receptor [Flavobacterium sp. WLB]